MKKLRFTVRLCGVTVVAGLNVILPRVVHAQNLVPNGSFEEYTECPTNYAQVDRAVGWSILSNSPDYFNRCNTNDSMDIPVNLVGDQDAYEGDAYMGVVSYLEDLPELRESIQRELGSPLVAGIPVYLSVMVSPGGFGNDPNNNSVQFATSGIGIKFSMQEHHADGVLWEGNVALFLPTVLNDTANWTHLSGIYVPDSAYAYIEIGCFKPNSEIVVEELDLAGVIPGAYVFVDQVCVSPNAIDCPLTIGIHEAIPPIWNIGPNPVGNELRLRLKGSLIQNASLQLFDGSGRLCLSERIPDGTEDFHWSLNAIANGSYYVQLQNSLGRFESIHIVHLQP